MSDEANALVSEKLKEWEPLSHEELSAMVGATGDYVEHELLERSGGVEWVRESQIFWDGDPGGDLRVWVDVWVLRPEQGKVLARDELLVERPGGPAARSPRWLGWLRRARS